MNAAMPKPSQDEIGLADVLERTGLSVEHLGQSLLQIEEQVLRSLASAGLPGDMHALQAFDLLKQTTDDIANLLERVALAAPSNAVLSCSAIIAPIKLEGLRAAIAQGQRPQHPAIANDHIAGVELF